MNDKLKPIIQKVKLFSKKTSVKITAGICCVALVGALGIVASPQAKDLFGSSIGKSDTQLQKVEDFGSVDVSTMNNYKNGAEKVFGVIVKLGILDKDGIIAKGLGTIFPVVGHILTGLGWLKDMFSEKQPDPIATALEEIKTKIDNLSAQVDTATTEILGTHEKFKLLGDVENVVTKQNKMSNDYYNNKGAYLLNTLSTLFEKAGQDKNKMDITNPEVLSAISDYLKKAKVDTTVASDVKLLNSSFRNIYYNDMLIPGEQNRDYYKEFLGFLDMVNGKNTLTGRDIFTVFEAYGSYEYDWNSQTFDIRQNFAKSVSQSVLNGYLPLKLALENDREENKINLESAQKSLKDLVDEGLCDNEGKCNKQYNSNNLRSSKAQAAQNERVFETPAKEFEYSSDMIATTKQNIIQVENDIKNLDNGVNEVSKNYDIANKHLHDEMRESIPASCTGLEKLDIPNEKTEATKYTQYIDELKKNKEYACYVYQKEGSSQTLIKTDVNVVADLKNGQWYGGTKYAQTYIPNVKETCSDFVQTKRYENETQTGLLGTVPEMIQYQTFWEFYKKISKNTYPCYVKKSTKEIIHGSNPFITDDSEEAKYLRNFTPPTKLTADKSPTYKAELSLAKLLKKYSIGFVYVGTNEKVVKNYRLNQEFKKDLSTITPYEDIVQSNFEFESEGNSDYNANEFFPLLRQFETNGSAKGNQIEPVLKESFKARTLSESEINILNTATKNRNTNLATEIKEVFSEKNRDLGIFMNKTEVVNDGTFLCYNFKNSWGGYEDPACNATKEWEGKRLQAKVLKDDNSTVSKDILMSVVYNPPVVSREYEGLAWTRHYSGNCDGRDQDSMFNNGFTNNVSESKWKPYKKLWDDREKPVMAYLEKVIYP